MAKRSFTYRFKVSATNDGYKRSQERNPKYIPNEIIYTFGKEVENIVECDNGTFVIKREDVRFRQPIILKKNEDVLRYQLRNVVCNYFNHCGVDKQDTCVVEYELLRKNIFSKNEFISDNFRDEIGFMVNAIKAIGDNTLINPNKEIAAMHFEIPLNYVSSQIFSILNVRTTSDSPEVAREYLKRFINAFFHLIPKDVIETYDTRYEEREKQRIKNATRGKESGKKLCSISPDKSKTDDEKAFTLVSRLIKNKLAYEIGYIIHCVYNGQRFGFQSFASWKKNIIVFLEIKESSTKYEDSNTPTSILNEISNKKYTDKVERFLNIINKHYNIIGIKNQAKVSAIFYKFQKECPAEYLNDKYKRRYPNTKEEKVFNRSEFKNLCLQYFNLKPNEYKPCKCEDFLLNSYDENLYVWGKIRPSKKD